MQLLIVAIILLLFAHDAIIGKLHHLDPWWQLHEFIMASLSLKLALALLFYFAIARVRRRLREGKAHHIWRWIGRVMTAYQLSVVVLFATDLAAGGLLLLRQPLSNLVFVDELLMLLPTLAMFVWQWWVYYPIDRRLRQAAVWRALDRGMTPPAIWTRGQYVRSQIRHQLGLIVVPLLLILAWTEFVEKLGPPPGGWEVVDSVYLLPLSLGGAGVMFVMLPLVLRAIWDTESLPAGEVRQFLLQMCEDTGVGVHDLLLWKTHGSIINAAVMGLHSKIRFILMTDGLLDQMDRKHIEAIMAHELAHVIYRHLIWLLVAAVSLGVAFQIALTPVAYGLFDLLPMQWLGNPPRDETVFVVVIIGMCFGWLWSFGVVSRQAEREADTFAVEHLSRRLVDGPRDAIGRRVIDAESARTMAGALDRVAELNHMSTAKHNWRHGSIVWRQKYLHSLIGRRIDNLPIHRRMWWINAAALAGLVLIIALTIAQSYMQ